MRAPFSSPGLFLRNAMKIIPGATSPVVCFLAFLLCVTSFGGSVWYGPAVGDADAVEDVTTQVMKY